VYFSLTETTLIMHTSRLLPLQDVMACTGPTFAVPFRYLDINLCARGWFRPPSPFIVLAAPMLLLLIHVQQMRTQNFSLGGGGGEWADLEAIYYLCFILKITL
jgi:hypothetical protein